MLCKKNETSNIFVCWFHLINELQFNCCKKLIIHYFFRIFAIYNIKRLIIKRAMVSSYEQNLIADALRVAQITKLPSATSPEDLTWLEGVAKIRLSDASVGYGIVKRNPNLSVSYKYINGNTAAIAAIEEVYPYESIDKRRIKKFSKDDDAGARVKYLKSLNLPYEINFENATIADLNKEVVKAALFIQLNTKED